MRVCLRSNVREREGWVQYLGEGEGWEEKARVYLWRDGSKYWSRVHRI